MATHASGSRALGPTTEGLDLHREKHAASIMACRSAHVLRLNKSNPGHASELCEFRGDVASGCIAMVTDKDHITLKPCVLKACTSGRKNGN